MSDNTSYSFSFSYNLDPQPNTTSRAEDLLAFDACLEFPLPDNQVLLHSPDSGKQTIVTQDVLFSLHQCHHFRTLREHNQQLQKAIPDLAGQTDDINQVLNSVSQSGLMLSAKKKAEELHLATTPPAAESGLCYCILTCDRPEAVSRLIKSMAKNHQFRSENHYFLVDDSRHAEHQQQNRHLCESFSREQQIELQYFGLTEQNQLQQQLEQAFPEYKEGIMFLLGRHGQGKATYGRTRNWALLLGTGGKLVVIDDDVLFQRIVTEEEPTRIALTSSTRSTDFFSSHQEWRTRIDKDYTDPTSGIFTTGLGRTLPQALALVSRDKLPPRAFRQLNPHDYAHFQPKSQVLITSCGSIGDPGTTGNTWLYLLDRDSRKNLIRSEDQYRKNILDRNMWSGRKEYAFLNTFVLISQITGIDASQCLPPYFPLQRNEDLLFGEMVRYMHPHALQLDLPWAVPHLPLEQRTWTKDQAMRIPQRGLLSFSAEMIGQQRAQNPAATPERRILSLADQFHCLAETTDRELLDRLTQVTLQHTTRQIQRMSNILAESQDAPEYWKTDMQSILRNLQHSLSSPTPDGFIDMDGDTETQRKTARHLWQTYAKGLQVWKSCTEWMQTKR
jgi:hypothetical protein